MKKKQIGFTILEALVAISILALCGIGLLASLYMGIDIVNDVRENIVASSVIQEEIEALRKTFFTQLPTLGTTTFTSNALSSLYNASGTVKVDNYIDSNIVRVVVTVEWYSRLKTNKKYTRSIVTLIAKNGINSI